MPVSQLEGEDPSNEKCRTFVFENEGHTFSNAITGIISSYADVEFCGYTVPHPAENKIHLRIQMHEGRPIDALKRGLEDLSKTCDLLSEYFTAEIAASAQSLGFA